jgi:hypothetical protein
MEEMNQSGMQYIYTWKCHNETPCIAILNKQSFFFLPKIENREAKQVLSGGWYQREGGGYKEKE